MLKFENKYDIGTFKNKKIRIFLFLITLRSLEMRFDGKMFKSLGQLSFFVNADGLIR